VKLRARGQQKDFPGTTALVLHQQLSSLLHFLGFFFKCVKSDSKSPQASCSHGGTESLSTRGTNQGSLDKVILEGKEPRR